MFRPLIPCFLVSWNSILEANRISEQLNFCAEGSDLFLAAAERLGANITAAVVVVGDSVWHLLAARRGKSAGDRTALGRLWTGRVGPGGGPGVHEDPANPLRHLDEVGLRSGQ